MLRLVGGIINARHISLIIVFVALTIALDPLRIPSMYLVGGYYRFCEIPIVAAFFLFGPKIAIAIASINILPETIFFPLPGVTIGRPFVLLLLIFMLFGIYLTQKFQNSKLTRNIGIKEGSLFTVSGALTRTLMAPIILYPLYRFLLPLVWVSLSDAQILAILPLQMIYALTFSLYTIPIGYTVARTISRNLKLNNEFQEHR